MEEKNKAQKICSTRGIPIARDTVPPGSLSPEELDESTQHQPLGGESKQN